MGIVMTATMAARHMTTIVDNGCSSERRTLRQRGGFILPAITGGHFIHQQSVHGRKGIVNRQTYNKGARSKRPLGWLSGFQRSPSFLTRDGTLSNLKSSISIPFSISFHETGVETGARGFGLTE